MKQRPALRAGYCAALALAAFAASLASATPPQAAAIIHPRLWPRQSPALARDAELEAQVEALLARMTPAQKAGQLVQIGRAHV